MRSFIIILYLISSLIPEDLFSQSDQLQKEIEKIIKYERSVDYNLVPGILVGVIDGDSTFRLAFGKDIDINGIFELGSLTKPFVAWLTNKALASLDLQRDAKVCFFLPDSLCTPAWEKVTFNHILDHRSGLARLAPGIGEIETDVRDPYKDYSLDLLTRDLKVMQPSPGKYSYSHIGYAMTYWLFERVGGLEAFTKANLTDPFLLHDTRWDIDNENISDGYGLDGRSQPPWNTNALKPAIGLRSSLNDMMTFIRLLIFGFESNQKLSESGSLKKELKSLSKAGAYKVVDGWFVVSSGKSLVYYHNGRTGGHHVSVAFTPNLKKGVVVISNGAMGSNDLSLLILRMINQAKRKAKA